MRGSRWRAPELDFLVIGAQKAGTTSLWRYLDDNPHIRMPPGKESPFFSEPAYEGGAGVRAYMRGLFRDAPRGARLGTVTPTYMIGAHGVDVPEIAGRIHATVPRVRLVALLRDPVERARSAHRMRVLVTGETRPFADAVRHLLRESELIAARRAPTPNSSYVIGGEYGRILSAYRALFASDQLLVELTADLDRDPDAVVRRVCEHVGAPPHEPSQLGSRFYAGGARRVSEEAEADLKGYLARHVWPRVRHAAQHRETFDQWFRLWNAEPGPPPAPLEDEIAAALRAHYAEDAQLLEAAVGVEVPWARAR